MKKYADYSVSTSSYAAPTKLYKAVHCYESHPVLKLGGGILVGGSCINPIHHDADVYIGLDNGMRPQAFEPWEGDEVIQFLYPITDMSAPSNAASFIKLVDWTCNQLQSGRKVHAGCIGGHGRTGTLFAAMFAVLNKDKDAIETVRDLYCKKAVESNSQVDFLNKHFGINKISATKTYSHNSWGQGDYSGGWATPSNSVNNSWSSQLKNSADTVFASAKKVWKPVRSSRAIIGKLF